MPIVCNKIPLKNFLKFLKKGIKYFQNPPIYITTEANKTFAKKLSQTLAKKLYDNYTEKITNNSP